MQMYLGGIGIGLLSFFVLTFMVSQLGNFHSYWIVRSKEWVQATTFMNSENCMNPLMRSKLGTFNLCDTSEKICSRYPVMSAVYDVAHDLNICGHGRCTVLYMDVTSNLHKIVVGSALLSFMGLYVFKKCCDDAKVDKQIHYYQLPTSHRKNL